MNADNASSNDTQTTQLAEMENSFDAVNRVRCFNHTLQLSAKTLLRPFNAGMASTKARDEDNASDEDEGDDDMPDLVALEQEDDENDENKDEDEDDTGGEDADDGVDELGTLSKVEREKLLADTAIVRKTVSKVSNLNLTMLVLLMNEQLRQLSFAVVRSTTIALPAWRRCCEKNNLKTKLIPRDVVTRWNSTHDMMKFALQYRKAIDAITADKSLKLRKFELDDDDWVIVEDLVSILEVCANRFLLYAV
jgi:hypothetical protein